MRRTLRSVTWILMLMAMLLVSACGQKTNAPAAPAAPATPSTGNSAPAPAPKELKQIKIGYIPLTDFLGMYAAAEKGLFEAEGLKAELIVMDGGAKIIPALEGGSIDFGISNILSVLQAQDQGLKPMIVVDSAYETKDHPVQALLVAGSSPIKSAKDLEGKKVAVNTRNNIVHLGVLNWLEKGGADTKKVTFVELPFPNMPAALTQGQIDAAAVVEPFVAVAKDQGAKVISYYLAEVNPLTMVAPLVAKKEWLEKNKEVAAAFARAVTKGNDMVTKDENLGREMAVKYAKLKPELKDKINLTMMKSKPDPKLVQYWIDQCKKIGWIKGDIKVDDLLWETVKS